MTIKGVKNLLNSNESLNLDEITDNTINNHTNNKYKILSKIRKINEIIKELKKFKNG